MHDEYTTYSETSLCSMPISAGNTRIPLLPRFLHGQHIQDDQACWGCGGGTKHTHHSQAEDYHPPTHRWMQDSGSEKNVAGRTVRPWPSSELCRRDGGGRPIAEQAAEQQQQQTCVRNTYSSSSLSSLTVVPIHSWFSLVHAYTRSLEGLQSRSAARGVRQSISLLLLLS